MLHMYVYECANAVDYVCIEIYPGVDVGDIKLKPNSTVIAQQ